MPYVTLSTIGYILQTEDEYLNIIAKEGFEQNNYNLSIEYRNNDLYDIDRDNPLNFGKSETDWTRDFIKFKKIGYNRIREKWKKATNTMEENLPYNKNKELTEEDIDNIILKAKINFFYNTNYKLSEMILKGIKLYSYKDNFIKFDISSLICYDDDEEFTNNLMYILNSPNQNITIKSNINLNY